MEGSGEMQWVDIEENPVNCNFKKKSVYIVLSIIMKKNNN